jgi:hypothetical protein
MEAKISLLCSQGPATGFHPEPDESSWPVLNITNFLIVQRFEVVSDSRWVVRIYVSGYHAWMRSKFV